MQSELHLAVTILLVSICFSTAIIIALARRLGSFANFRIYAMLSYTIVYIVSGVVHIADRQRQRRGYFDAVARLEPNEIVELAVVNTVGLFALSAGLFFHRGTAPAMQNPRTLGPREKSLLALTIPILFIASLWGLIQMRAYASSQSIGRTITVPEGMARYYFLSMWFVPAIYLAVVILSNSTADRSKVVNGLYLLLGIAAIAWSLQWTGGRSSALILSIPLVMVMLTRTIEKKVSGLILVTLAGVGMAAFIARQTEQRFAYARHGTTGISDWLDWEWGRFSLSGYAFDRANEFGLIRGESVWRSLSDIVSPFISTGGFTEWRTSTEIAAEDLLHSGDAIHIVPGLSAELLLNFGVVGLAGGYFLLGWLADWIDHRYRSSSSIITQLFWAYVGVIVVFIGPISDLGTIITAVLFRGAPLLVIAAIASRISHLEPDRSGLNRGKRALQT